jgi:hypothetical protein
MNVSDSVIYDKIFSPPEEDMPFVNKEVLYVNDINNSSYNGQIQIETSSLSNSGNWLDYANGHLVIPFVVQMSSNANQSGAGVINSFSAIIKSGFHQLIDSIQVDYNGTTVVQQQPFSNFYNHFRIMTTMSADDLKKHGDLIGFYPDSSDSFRFEAAGGGSPSGLGLSNNTLFNTLETSPEAFGDWTTNGNLGAWERGKTVAPFDEKGDSARGVTVQALTNLQQSLASFYTYTAPTDATRLYRWVYCAVIRLKDLTDFFGKMPILKGGLLRVILNYNTASFTITHGAGPALSVTTYQQKTGRINPLMMSSGLATQPNGSVVNGTLTFNMGVVEVDGYRPYAFGTRLYVPSYNLDPAYESRIISTMSIREVAYTDFYNFNVVNVGAGSPFNQILTNSLPNIKYVVVIPTPTVNNAGAGLTTGKEYQSPFSSSPATTCPDASITNFNVLVGGQNIFQQNFNYDFEAFKNELQSVNAVNGGVVDGLTSGLISYKDWSRAYRYYVADVARRLPHEKDNLMSIQIVGTNNTSIAMDYICFVVFEKKISIKLIDGSIA